MQRNEEVGLFYEVVKNPIPPSVASYCGGRVNRNLRITPPGGVPLFISPERAYGYLLKSHSTQPSGAVACGRRGQTV